MNTLVKLNEVKIFPFLNPYLPQFSDSPMKLQPHYSQSSRENATLLSGIIPLACYKEVPPPVGLRRF